MSTAMPGPGPANPSEGAGDRAVLTKLLGDPELRRFLRDYVKKRVQAGDVDDVVQTVLVDALAASKRPEDPTEVRKWLVGIARHKCADVHRRAGRERPPEEELPDLPAQPPPLEERALVRWAEEQAKSSREAGKTLDWMAREGEGDKLEHIAEEEQLPPARVRQRVSRMRRMLKERWLAEIALVAALGAIAFLLWKTLRREDEGPIIADPTPAPTGKVSPIEERIAEGRRVRTEALEVCRNDEHQRCIEQLDRARDLDPTGDADPSVVGARQRATDALAPPRQKSDSIEKGDPESTPTTLPPAPNPSTPLTGKPKAPPPPPKKPEPKFDKGSFDQKGSDASEVQSPDPPPAPEKEAKAPPPAPPTQAPPPQQPAQTFPTKGGGKGSRK